MSDDDFTPPTKFPGGTWMLAMFEGLDRRLTAHGSEMRDGFKATRADVAALGTKLDDHAHDDATVEQRVALIEQARAIEAKTVSKHGATAGLFAGGSVMIVWEVVKHLAGWK